MTYDEIVALVGHDRYEAESLLARQDAKRSDYGRGGGAELSLPHEMEELVWNESCPWAERIALLFRFYDDMPCYAHLMYANQRYREFDSSGRSDWWANVRMRLADQDVSFRQPLQYALWCDFFEDGDVVSEAWAVLTNAEAADSVLRAVLPVSGPVPYELKASLYQRLIGDPSWHIPIFQSLLGSAFDVFGQLDLSAARQVFRSLRLPSNLPDLDQLRGKLA